MFRHKFDKRKSGEEGAYAEYVYGEITKFKKTGKKEDCAGIDFEGGIDVKARKKGLPGPHLTWLELAASMREMGTGWAYADKYVAQMMCYEEDNHLVDVIFGEYYVPDLKILLAKVDFSKLVDKKDCFYKLYSRPHPLYKDTHSGIMTVVTYDDLKSLPSFKERLVPREYWSRLLSIYCYDGIKQTQQLSS